VVSSVSTSPRGIDHLRLTDFSFFPVLSIFTYLGAPGRPQKRPQVKTKIQGRNEKKSTVSQKKPPIKCDNENFSRILTLVYIGRVGEA
jgi:hypothetical protein